MNDKNNNIFELPSAVRSAICNHVTVDKNISKHDLDNAWKTFCNLLEQSEVSKNQMEVKQNTYSRSLSYAFYRYFKLATLSLSVACLTYVYVNYNDSSKIEVAETSSVDAKLAARDYILPNPDHFSELVTFVEDDSISKYAQPQDTELSRRLTAELENSLRESFRVPDNGNNNSPHLVFVAND